MRKLERISSHRCLEALQLWLMVSSGQNHRLSAKKRGRMKTHQRASSSRQQCNLDLVPNQSCLRPKKRGRMKTHQRASSSPHQCYLDKIPNYPSLQPTKRGRMKTHQRASSSRQQCNLVLVPNQSNLRLKSLKRVRSFILQKLKWPHTMIRQKAWRSQKLHYLDNKSS